MRSRHDDNEAAFAEFVRVRQLALVRFAWLVSGGSYATAEDLVQDALARLYGRWDQVSDPEPYVRTTIVRLNVSRWRSARREVLTALHVDRPVADPELELVESDTGLMRQVLALPKRQRTAVILRYWCDQSTEQIAAALGTSPITVRSNLNRAVQRLRTTWPAADPASTHGRQR